MERQSSFGSQGSAKSSATKLVQDAQKHGESVENQNANNGFTTALFGVLFTLAKEKYSDSWKVAVLTVIVDFLLILAIMFNLEYPWAVDPHNGVFKFFYMLEIHKPLSTAGYKFYVIVFYLLSAMLYVSVAICVWVAWCFKNDSFPYLWPIKFVRVVASLFFGMLYIAALNIFLVIVECAPEHGVWKQHIWHVECLAMPHLIHGTFSILSCIIFAVAALLLVIADHELQPMSRSLLAAPHSMTELKAQLAKTVITVVDVLLWDFPRVQGVVFALCTGATFYFHLKQLPYYTSWMNSFRLCFFAVHAWVGLHLGVLVFLVKSHKVKKGSLGFIEWQTENYNTAQSITNSMLYGLPVVFFGAGLLGAIRLYYFFRVALKFQIRQHQPNLYSKRIHRFSDEKEVEVCSRIGRVWDEDGNVDQQCLDLAETILRAGLQQFPKSPYLHIVYANLLIECRQQLQSGRAQLEEARRMPLNLSYRFSIFTREQEHKQKAAVSSSGESAADLVSYVEFQRNYRMIQSYHKAALLAMREFWRLLLHDAVNMNSLTSAFRKIEQMERLADKTYKMVLERYPKAVKLLRSYALFLEMVKNDPWTAAQFYTEAEKQEEALENAEHDLAGQEGLTMRNSAIVTINAMGIIQMANKHAIKMLGYNKGELEGKNVSCLMPQPFSARHNTYLRNYTTTGKAKILDELREVVALHRDRYVFPIKILVSNSQGNGADAVFMGLLKEVEADPKQIKAWLMPNGVTLCADMSFTDYAGWAPNDLIGKPFNSVAVDPVAVDKLLEKAMKATAEELAEGDLQADIMLLHKYAEDVPVTVRVELGGTSDQRLLVLNMTRVGEVVPTMVLDHHGRVLFTNQALCSLMGTKPKDMRGRDLGTLMPQPFGYLHHRWIKDAESALVTAKLPPFSCRAGAVHSLVSSNGVHVPVRMVISSRELPGGVHVNIVRATRVTLDEALDEQRLNITTDQHGHIISVSSASHHHPHGSITGAPPTIAPTAVELGDGAAPRPQVFGYPPENLVGRKLYEAVDIFEEWHGQGHSVMHAVKALAQHSAARPGSAWRVGVLPHYVSLEVEKATLKLAKHGDDGADEPRSSVPGMRTERQMSHRRSMRRNATMLRASLAKWRAAIMQVMGPEHTATGTHYTIKLWRPEMLSGVLEINEKMAVVKADSAAGLIFGVPSYTMSQQPLSRFLKLGPPGSNSVRKLGGATAGTDTRDTAVAAGGDDGGGRGDAGGGGGGGGGGGNAKAAALLITKESLLGNNHVKGGMKGGKLAHKTGPRRIFEARHADGMPLQVSFQVALKNGTSANRLMAAIKPLNLIKGNVAVLFAAMRGEDLDHYIDEVDSRSFHRLRSETSQRRPLTAGISGKDFTAAAAAAVAAVEPPAAAATAATEVPLPKTQSWLSARATGVAPGMSSARTLGAGVGVGSLGTGSNDPNVAMKVLEDSTGGKPVSSEGSARITVDEALIASPLATARNVELKLADQDGGGEAAECKAGGAAAAAAAAEQAAVGPGTTELDVTTGQGCGRTSESLLGGSDANGRPTNADKTIILRQAASHGQQAHAAVEGQEGQQQEGMTGGEGQREDASALSYPHPHSHSHQHHHHANYGRTISRKFVTRDWDHVMDVDPDQVPIPHDADYDIEHHWGDEKDMTVSSSSSSRDDDGSDSESDQHVGRNTAGAADKMTREEALQRKKTMAALEPSERVQYVKGVRRVKEWLASGYYFDRRDAEPMDTEVHRNMASTVDPWRSSGTRQLSLHLEEAEVGIEDQKDRTHNKHDGGAAGGSAAAAAGLQGTAGAPMAAAAAAWDDALNPDDQLMTLDDLAAEVEQQDDKSEEEEEADGDGDGDAASGREGGGRGDGAGGRGGGRHGGKRAGRRRRRSRHAWGDEEDGSVHGGAHSHAMTAGGSSIGRLRGGGDGGGGRRDDASSVTGHSAVESSGMSRGRRLKRLLKLLSGQKVSRGVSRLRMHVLIIVGAMMLLHTVCFMLVIIYINKQKQFITEISAAGEAIDRTFYTAMYCRAIEAATRSVGFSFADILSLESRLTTDVDRLEYLHQGLYLGFNGLRRSRSARLNDLWGLKQWNVTEYQDTKVPTFNYVLATLWSLGSDFISAVREVAYYAVANKLLIQSSAVASGPAAVTATTTATLTFGTNATNGTLASASSPPMVASGAMTTNVTLVLNRFWLFIRDNAGESLYTGYLRVLDTLLLLAQDNISMLKLIIIALLLVEGCLVCFAAVGYVFWLLWKATRARAALFTVFLVIPQGQVKALASRHITTAQSDDDSDDDGEKARQEAAERDRDGGGGGGGGGSDQVSDGASVLSGGAASAAGGGGGRGGGGGGTRRSFTIAENSRASSTAPAASRRGITFKENPKRKSQTAAKQSATMFARLKHAMSGEVTVPEMENKTGRPRRFFTKKRLTHTTSDIKNLAWPFFAWGVIIVVIYLVSYLHFANVEESLVNLKMFERSTAQASRTMYYVNELALEADTARQALLQPIVASEASWLDAVYSTTLYGGHTLSDSEKFGARDHNTGSLFAAEHHALLLFGSTACMRDSGSACLSESDPYYEVSRHAIDPMMRRLMQEATLLSLDDLADVNPSSTRWQYTWTVAQQDLHDGLEALVNGYRSDALAAFKAQGTLHTVVFAIAWVLWALYLWLLLKPYLQISSTETKRVAEMLSQLPTELDVEGMVEESWQVVANSQVEGSGGGGGTGPKVEGKRLSVSNMALSVFAAMRMASISAAKRLSVASGTSSRGRGSLLKDAAEDRGDDPDGGGGRSGSGGGSQADPRVPERDSSMGSNSGRSLLSARLKAALKGAGGKGLDDDGGGKAGGGDGGGDPRAAVRNRRGSGTVEAPRPGHGSQGQASPADSARAPSRPGSASGSAVDGKTPPQPWRPGSGRHNNRVVPVDNSPSGQWFSSDGGVGDGTAAVADAVERPRSSLLTFNLPHALRTLKEEEASGNEEIEHNDKGGSRPSSPFHFNKVMVVQNNNTQYWTDDEPWWPPVVSTPPPGPSGGSDPPGEALNRAGEAGNGSGSGRSAIESVAVAAVALGSGTVEDQTLLPGEVDDPRVASARLGSAGSLADSLAGGVRQTPPTTRSLPSQPPPLLLLEAAAERQSFSGGGLGRDSLAAGSSRPASPVIISMTAAGDDGPRVSTPTLGSPPGAMATALAAATAAGLAAANGGSRVGPPRPMSSSSPMRTPTEAGAATARGPRAGTISALGDITSAPQSPATYRGSLDAGSRPPSRLAGSAANIDLPPPPAFGRTGNGTYAATAAAAASPSAPLAKLASLNAAAAAVAANAPMATAAAMTAGVGADVAVGSSSSGGCVGAGSRPQSSGAMVRGLEPLRTGNSLEVPSRGGPAAAAGADIPLLVPEAAGSAKDATTQPPTSPPAPAALPAPAPERLGSAGRPGSSLLTVQDPSS